MGFIDFVGYAVPVVFNAVVSTAVICVQGLAALEKILERAYQHHFQAAATSHDYDYYTNLRNQAIHEGDLTGKAFSESRQAYSSGDRAVAHSSSQEGKSHQAKRDQLNLEASQWIFAHNNKDCQSGTIDLHGLFVAEALRETESAIKVSKSKNLPQLRIITGKGSHSPQSISKLKPAIEKFMKDEKLAVKLEVGNEGVLVVDLTGGRRGGWDEVVKVTGCAIM